MSKLSFGLIDAADIDTSDQDKRNPKSKGLNPISAERSNFLRVLTTPLMLIVGYSEPHRGVCASDSRGTSRIGLGKGVAGISAVEMAPADHLPLSSLPPILRFLPDLRIPLNLDLVRGRD